jgi:cyclic di-GMP phosphodiesterase
MLLSDGIEFCGRFRANRRADLIPVLMLSPCGTVEDEVAGIASGADEFLARPFHPAVLQARVGRMLRHKAIVDRLEESETILLALAQTVEQRDNHTAGHCERLAALSMAMGMAMELPAHQILALHRGGYLHDVGKIAIPDSVLLKKGPLTEAEWVVMRTHTTKGEDICRGIKCLNPVLPIIRSHHERWNGSGYPDGLAGHDIPLLARVLQFADIYDALMAERPYKSPMSSARALQVMQEETDRGWHDPELMRLFLRMRHDMVREAAAGNGARWQDVQVMRESLENLQSAILRS